MKGFKILIISITLFAFNLQYGQQEEKVLSLDEGPLVDQFEFLTKKSGNYNANGIRYEVVKVGTIVKLRKNVLDSMRVANQKALDLQTKISAQENTISSLNAKLKETTENLTSVTEEKDSMSFFGLLVSKATYNIVLWSIIIGLFVLLLLFIYKFRNSNTLTQEAKTALTEVEDEFEQHRRRALEREQKISRQLQDELNKQKKPK